MNLLYPLLVVLLAMFAIAPLEYPGPFQSHSGLLASYNLINLDQNPWQFLTWAPTVGQAYDLFRVDGSLPYLIAELFHLLGLSYLDSIKLVYAVAWVASGIALYALARRYLSQPAALLAGTVYVYLPSHLAAVYVRGAFAESVAWALFPVVFWAVDRGAQLGDRRRPTPDKPPSSAQGLNSARPWLMAYGYLLPFAVLFLTQPGLSILWGLVTFLIVAVPRWRVPGGLRHASEVVFGGLGVGALVALPSILTHGAGIASGGFVPNFVMPFQLFSPLWGYGVSTGNFLDQFPLQLGVVPLALAIFAVALAWTSRDLAAVPIRRNVKAWLLAACVLVLLTLGFSSPVWSLVGLFASYPWQLLAFIGLLLALVSATIVDLDPRLSRPTMLAVFVALPVVATYGYLTPRYVDFNPTRPVIGVFGNHEIALLDYRIVGPLRHGATVRLEMQWQALRPIDHDYTVFVHAVQEDGQTYGQVDEKPVGGTLPTLKWTTGQVISDTHTIQIDVDGPREGYVLQVGLYYGATGQRALLEDGTDHLELPRPQDPEPTVTDQPPVAVILEKTRLLSDSSY